MNNKRKSTFISAIVMFFVFLVYTVLVKAVDVKAIGPEGSSVGFASINSAVNKVFPYNEMLYKISDYLGYAALGVCFAFALYGLWQLIKGKSFKSVDKQIWVLAGFYVVVFGFYAVFEKVVINYRPIILDEGLEASYPSSHTMLATCVFFSACVMLDRILIEKKVLKNVLEALLILSTAATIILRAFCGVHWFSDILGGLILSLSLFCFFVSAILKVEEK